MLSLFDPVAGAATPLASARPRQLRTWTVAAGSQDGDAAELRPYVLADVVRRVAESHNLQVSAWYTVGEADAEDRALTKAWAALNVHPLEPVPEPPAALDLGIGPQPARAEVRWLAAAPARPANGAGKSPAVIGARGLDPLALRLVFLRRHYAEPVDLTWDELTAADQTVREWRGLVADWANSPSKPMCAQYTADIKGAFDDDLDTPAALRAVAALAADPEIPAGSKFETFVHLDHLLGLDLARDIGR